MKNVKMFNRTFGTLAFNKEITDIVESLASVSVEVSAKLSMANLNNDELEVSDKKNCQGEFVHNMDIYANDRFIDKLRSCDSVAAVISEENYLPVRFAQGFFGAQYIVAIDPLDGSSNIDVNIPVGSIFAIYDGADVSAETLSGDKIVAAGYLLYGSSLQLVLSDGRGTSVFVYDQIKKRYILADECLKIPKSGSVYSVNEANYNLFDKQSQRFIDTCRSNVNVSSRYVGSFVSDFHRNLIKGGVYLYPSTNTYPNGKLRLLYECYPLAFIVEASGGKSISGNDYTLNKRLNIEDNKRIYLPIHQRASLVIGSPDMVTEFVKLEERAKLRTA